MELVLSEGEMKSIEIWADNTIHGGHWGDGDFMIPEENIILEKLQRARKDGKLQITSNEARIILSWSETARGIYTMEEESAIRKLKTAMFEGI